MMYCQKCGKQNEDNATFCVDCGTELFPEKSRRERRGKDGGRMSVSDFLAVEQSQASFLDY